MSIQDADYELARIRFRKLYKKAKELNIQEEDLKQIPFVTKFQKKKINIIHLVFKWITYSVLLLLLLSALFFISIKKGFVQGKTVAEWSTYFTGIDLQNDQCVIPFTELILDVFRPPQDCSFCRGIKEFDRVTNLSQTDFVEKYAYSGRPVIITDATSNWTAKSEFSFDYLKSVYKKDSPVLGNEGNGDCQFFPYKTKFTSVGDVFKMSKKMKQMNGDPWYIGWSNCDSHAANILRKHYTRPYFLSPEMESSRTDWIFMGTPGYGAHIHIDNVQQSSWQAQIQGDKEWMLEPPPECYYQCNSFKDTVRAGEVIVLDTNRWFHGTNVVGKKLSIVIGSEYD